VHHVLALPQKRGWMRKESQTFAWAKRRNRSTGTTSNTASSAVTYHRTNLKANIYGCSNASKMLPICCNSLVRSRRSQIRVYDEPLPSPQLVELRHSDAHSQLPRSGTVRLPRSFTTPWLQQNVSTRDVVKSSQTQKNLASTIQDCQNFMKDKKVGSDGRFV